jgi:hypothetical protein
MRRTSVCSAGLAVAFLISAGIPSAEGTVGARPAVSWEVTLPIDVRHGSTAIDRRGDVYVTGTRTTGRPAAVITKLGRDGSPLWTRVWSPGGAERVSGEYVAVAADGSVYLAGSVGSHYEGGAWFLRRYSSDGELLWGRDEPGWRHGRTAEGPTGLAVADDQVLLAGRFQGCCGDLRVIDGWVLSFGLDGERRWRDPFEAPGYGPFSDEADAIAVGGAGRIYVVGWTATGAESDELAAPHVLFVQALSADGDPEWSRMYPATAHRDQHFGADVAIRGQMLVVSALVDGPPVNVTRSRPGHAWLSRLTPDGDRLWTRRWGVSWTGAAQPTAVALGVRGRIDVVGTRRDASDHGLDAFVRRYTSWGRMLWNATLEEGQRLMEGGDVASTPRGFSVTAEAMESRYRPSLGHLWMFTEP